MAMVAFYQLVDKSHALDETRSLVLGEGHVLPPDGYAFMEFYCDDPRCDCRRVIFQVWRRSTGSKVWATITYGWEPAAYYATWSKSPSLAYTDEMSGAQLDPICPQSELSVGILGMAKELLLSDPSYVDRLKRHYREACPRRGRVARESTSWKARQRMRRRRKG